MNTYKEVLHSPVFESLLTVQSEVRRVIRALVVPKRKDFHLDLTKKIESMTSGRGGRRKYCAKFA